MLRILVDVKHQFAEAVRNNKLNYAHDLVFLIM